MTRHDRYPRAHSHMLYLALLCFLVSLPAWAGTWAYYACTLRAVLPGGGDVVLLVGAEDGQVRQCGLDVAGGDAAYQVREQHLRVAGGRLQGPLRLQLGTEVELFELDTALAGGGIYRRACTWPGVRATSDGPVKVDAPRDATSNRYTLWLPDALRPGANIALPFTVDRVAKTFTALPASANGFNRAQHPVDAAGLTFDGTTLAGTLGITVVADAWVPAHKRPLGGHITLRAALDGGDNAGTFTATFDLNGQWLQGAVEVAPTTAARLQALLDPILSPYTAWRAYLVEGPCVTRENKDLRWTVSTHGHIVTELFDPANLSEVAQARFTARPPADWAGPAFDDHTWYRYQRDDLRDALVGDYGLAMDTQWSGPSTLYLRTTFGIADPARATDLQVTVTGIGGGIVYVNGVEVGRGYLPAGELTPFTLADDYPLTAYTTEDGVTPLPALQLTAAPEAKWLDRYAQRIRTFTVSVPARVLAQGRNVLAVEMRGAPMAGPGSWSHMGVQKIELTSVSRAGVITAAQASKGTRVWSAAPEEQVADTIAPQPILRRSWFHALFWARGMPVKGVCMASPFDPVRPVRFQVPRNGAGSGQTVLSDSDGLHDIAASLGPLTGPGGATIPVEAVQLRYAVQHAGIHYCDALMAQPPDGARTVPVWVLVQAPKTQAPGWYTAGLMLRANGQTFTVPVQVLVTGVTMPDARDFTTTIGVEESPDTVARQYGVELWSPEHFALLEKSFALMGQVGNDVIHVPVILGLLGGTGKSSFRFNQEPMIRWVKTEHGLEPDFSILEQYLDRYTKYCAPPRGISLYIWSYGTAKEFARAYENWKPGAENWSSAKAQYTPPQIRVWDPQTRTTSVADAPVIGEPGSEPFWKALIDGVRALVVKRGWSERVVMLGLGGDDRPGRKTVDLLKQWAPYARWNFLSHYSGDPGPKAGVLIASGGADIGMKEWPWMTFCGVQPAASLEERLTTPNDFLELPTNRWQHQEFSPPFVFRTMPQQSGYLGRIGLDHWKAGEGGPSATSFFSHTNALTWPGPDGTVPTVRFEMLREGVQDMEVRHIIIRAYQQLPEAERAPYRKLIDELRWRVGAGSGYLSQHELQFDWPDYLGRLYKAAAELTGVKSDATWDAPPAE